MVWVGVGEIDSEGSESLPEMASEQDHGGSIPTPPQNK